MAVTAAGQRETAEEPGGAEAPPPTRRRGSGSGSQQALPESERRCLAQTSGQPTPRKAAGRVRAARAEHRFFFFSLGHCCLGLLPAPRTLPSRGRPAWDGAWVCLGLGPGRWRWGETRGGRRGRLHLPRSPGPLRPFRAGPARSQPGRASATAPPASGARAPARRRSGSSRAGPGRAPRARRRGAATGRGAPSPRACAARPRLRGKETLERASPRPGARGRGRGAGGGAPGRSPERRRGAELWVRGAEAGGPAASGSARRPQPPPPPTKRAGFPERPALEAGRSLQPPQAAGRRWPEPARDPRLARRTRRGLPRGARRGCGRASAGVRGPGWPRRRVPRAPGSLSSCSDCVSVSCLCSWGGPRAPAGLRAGAGPVPASAPASTP